MEASTVEVIARSCAHKRAYGARCARIVAQRMREQGKRVSPYRCFNCGAWHIGAVPSLDQLRRIADAIRDLHGNRPGHPTGHPTGHPRGRGAGERTRTSTPEGTGT